MIFIVWGFCPLVMLSILAFLCPPTWSHDGNVDCPHLYHVIMGSYTLIVGVLKYFLSWVFCRFDFYCWGFFPMVLLSILAFLCRPTWSHDENVDCPHLYHVIMGSYTLIVGVSKYFLFWGFCLLWFLSFGAFVVWCFCPYWLFSVSPRDHRQECLLSQHISCDYGIVHLDCWSIKIFSLLGFCLLSFLSFGFFVLWCFCPFWLFSVRPCDRMTRMLIVHTCIMWSWNRTPWLLEY